MTMHLIVSSYTMQVFYILNAHYDIQIIPTIFINVIPHSQTAILLFYQFGWENVQRKRAVWLHETNTNTGQKLIQATY